MDIGPLFGFKCTFHSTKNYSLRYIFLRLWLGSFYISEIDLRIKGSSDPSHFINEINVGKGRIRHTTTLKLNDEFLDRLK